MMRLVSMRLVPSGGHASVVNVQWHVRRRRDEAEGGPRGGAEAPIHGAVEFLEALVELVLRQLQALTERGCGVAGLGEGTATRS